MTGPDRLCCRRARREDASIGQYAVEARDATWAKCYEILALVESGSRQIPTLDELLAELPVLAWPQTYAEFVAEQM